MLLPRDTKPLQQPTPIDWPVKISLSSPDALRPMHTAEMDMLLHVEESVGEVVVDLNKVDRVAKEDVELLDRTVGVAEPLEVVAQAKLPTLDPIRISLDYMRPTLALSLRATNVRQCTILALRHDDTRTLYSTLSRLSRPSIHFFLQKSSTRIYDRSYQPWYSAFTLCTARAVLHFQ